MRVNGDTGHKRTQEERSRTTRAALMAAARRLFAEQGFAGTGREEIVREAGVTRGAMYHHFASKEALFRAVYEEIENEVVTAVAAAAVEVNGPMEQLRRGCHSFLDAALDPAFQRIVLLEGPAVLDAATYQELSETYGLAIMRMALLEAAEAGAIGEVPIEPLAHMLLAALHAGARLVAQDPQPARRRKEAGKSVDYLLDCLR